MMMARMMTIMGAHVKRVAILRNRHKKYLKIASECMQTGPFWFTMYSGLTLLTALCAEADLSTIPCRRKLASFVPSVFYHDLAKFNDGDSLGPQTYRSSGTNYHAKFNSSIFSRCDADLFFFLQQYSAPESPSI